MQPTLSIHNIKHTHIDIHAIHTNTTAQTHSAHIILAQTNTHARNLNTNLNITRHAPLPTTQNTRNTSARTRNKIDTLAHISHLQQYSRTGSGDRRQALNSSVFTVHHKQFHKFQLPTIRDLTEPN